MKIGVITFHHAKNSYGASLQALATIRVLRSIGHEAELINYENRYEQAEIKGNRVPLKRRVSLYLSLITRLYLFGGWKNPYRHRENHDKMYKYITKERYTEIGQMHNLHYDVLLAGSDQIWNPEVTKELDKAFLLKFGQAKKRISYASSMGSYKLNKSDKKEFELALKSFNAISVREEHARGQLLGCTDKNIKVVLDPTLLLNKEMWEDEFKIDNKEYPPYILTYFVAGNLDSYWNHIESYVEAMQMPIWNIQSHAKKSKHAQRIIYCVPLSKIVSLHRNASLIITDSFHGTAFSINFHKKFVAIKNKKNPVRVANLLELLKLSDRLCIAPQKILDEIDYMKVDTSLNALRQDSLGWLNKALQE
jgi:hypothetical protein